MTDGKTSRLVYAKWYSTRVTLKGRKKGNALEVRILSLIQKYENNSKMNVLNILKKGERLFLNTKKGKEILLVLDVDFIRHRYLLLNRNTHQVHDISFEHYLEYLQGLKYKLLKGDE